MAERDFGKIPISMEICVWELLDELIRNLPSDFENSKSQFQYSGPQLRKMFYSHKNLMKICLQSVFG